MKNHSLSITRYLHVLIPIIVFVFLGSMVYVNQQREKQRVNNELYGQQVDAVKKEIASDATSISISNEIWQQLVTPDQYNVIVKKQTEAPYANQEMLSEKREGLYVTVGCNQPVFVSTTKYDSQTGWPSFWQAIPDSTRTEKDMSFGIERDAVYATRCNEYLGHVFPDGPEPTGLRYCINSPALKFIPKEELSQEQLRIFEGNEYP